MLKRYTSSDALLILSVLVIASCGLAYELIAGALASYVLGDSVLQFSTVIGTYLFAMGIGSHLSKYIPENQLIRRFVEIEILVGLIGGLSAIGLFLSFAWLPQFKTLLYSIVLCIGVLVGMEIPLVMRILHARKQAFSQLVSQVLTFDYLGALIVSLLFPMVLAPRLGLARSAVLFGMFNVLIAGWTTWHFYRKNIPNSNTQPPEQTATKQHRQYLLNRVLFASIILLFAMLYADRLVTFSEQKRFNAPIIYATASPYQRLVVTKRKGQLQLFLNGNLQFSSRDEYRYHEALVHPAMQHLQDKLNPMRANLNVLILGGGDGMAAREVLKYPQVQSITLVDLDQKMTDTFAQQPKFTALNQHSLTHNKLTVINTDAYQWLNEQRLNQHQPLYDLILIDLPDPSQYSLAKLYSVSMYQLVSQQLASDGVVVVQATSPYYAPKSFWCINATLAAANFNTTPYHVYVPSFGEWGFIIAKKPQDPAYHIPASYSVPLKFLTPNITQAMFSFAADMQPVAVTANTLDKQPLVRYYQEDWADE